MQHTPRDTQVRGEMAKRSREEKKGREIEKGRRSKVWPLD